jgi:hypothetical protein
MNTLHQPPAACRESSLLADEPLWGTADQVDSWLLLEHRGEWTEQAIVGHGLDAATDEWLKESLRALFGLGLRPRLLFVRQPDIERDGINLMLNLCGRPDPLLFRFELGGYAELGGIDVTRCAVEPARFAADVLAEPHYLVCANAKRDQCCGRYGVPLYLALRRRLGDRVWQCTHVGGHRFAPNVLKVPDGELYGRVDIGELGEFIERVESGEVPARWLRGRTAWPFHAQAAEAMLGDGQAAARLLASEALAEDRWRVRLERDGHEHVLVVGLAESRDILASCRDAAAKPIRPFVQLS